jgi:2,3-bisphosphoglycerate-dependent phosphoglycerate mutase
MRNITKTLLIGVTLLFAISCLQAQSKTTTIILLRHAEKDTSAAGSKMMQADPPLFKEGKTRAENLILALNDYKPDAIYSTNYNRTRSTVEPLAQKYKIEIGSYDPRNQKALAEQLKSMNGKTIVVVGHSNTIPRLVNLIIDAEGKYPDMDDSVYNKLYIVKITEGSATVEIKQY